MPQNRQLAAIMFTDIVGYTTLMGNDEQKAFALLKKNREIQKPIIQQFNGRWIKELGDGVMASFNSVSDAVNAAIKIQEASIRSNEFLLRIGIHQGEVVIDQEDIFGDAVNIASRIQAIAAPGRIYVSESVYQNVTNKKNFHTEYVKEETLKNVKVPVKIYQVINQKNNIDNTRENSGKEAVTLIEKSIHEKSIAVLPFLNLSGDPENDFFCDGLSEELLNVLAQVENLKVAARTSSFLFKGKETDIKVIGGKLNVSNILQGSFRKSGNRVRITAQLINVADGFHLWSDRYDRQMEDIFDIQDEISLAILEALKVKLLGNEKDKILKRYTDNTEAYQLYLQGRFHYNKWMGASGYMKAIEYYNEAIEKDEDYALAYSGKAACYLNLWFFGHLPPEQTLPQLKEATFRTIAIDDKIAESHVSFARMKFWYEWDFIGAELEFRKAIELNPNNAEAHEQFGMMLGILRRNIDAAKHAAKAIELDPFSLMINWGAGWISWLIDDLEKMDHFARKLIEMEPSFFGGHIILGTLCWISGKYEEALSELKLSCELENGPFTLSWLGCIYGTTGEEQKAREILAKLLNISYSQSVPNYYLAIVYAGLNQTEPALSSLERACDLHEGILVYFRHHLKYLIPDFSNEPGSSRILERIGLTS